MATKGYSRPGSGAVYTRARELCRQVGETPQLFPVLRGLWLFYHVRGEYQTAHELGEQLLSLAQRLQDPALLVGAHRTLGDLYSGLESWPLPETHLEQGIALYDPQQHRSSVFLYGHDPGVFGLSYAALDLWFLGYPDQALKRSHEALTLAQELSHPFSLAMALALLPCSINSAGRSTQLKSGQRQSLPSRASRVSDLVGGGTILRGWALAEQGQGEEGIAQMHQGLAA